MIRFEFQIVVVHIWNLVIWTNDNDWLMKNSSLRICLFFIDTYILLVIIIELRLLRLFISIWMILWHHILIFLNLFDFLQVSNRFIKTMSFFNYILRRLSNLLAIHLIEWFDTGNRERMWLELIVQYSWNWIIISLKLLPSIWLYLDLALFLLLLLIRLNWELIWLLILY